MGIGVPTINKCYKLIVNYSNMQIKKKQAAPTHIHGKLQMWIECVKSLEECLFPRAYYFSHGLGFWRCLHLIQSLNSYRFNWLGWFIAIVMDLRMMVKFRNVNNLTSFSHFDIFLLVDHLLQVVLRTLHWGVGGYPTGWPCKRAAGGTCPPVYMSKETLT
jgi:hypothetical protein